MFSLGDYIRLLWLLVSFGFPRISLRCFFHILSFVICFFLSYPSSYVSFLSTDVFTSPMWAELNHVEDPSLRCLAEKLPEVVLGSRADNTTLSYLNGFKRWRSWACKFPEITVLPATPAYVSLYLLSVLQASTSPAPVQTAFYSIRWAHEIAGFESPTSHTLPQRVFGSAKRRSFPLLRRAQSYVPGSISLIIYLRPKSRCPHLPLVVTIFFLVTSKQSLAVNLFAWDPRYLIPGVGKCYLRS